MEKNILVLVNPEKDKNLVFTKQVINFLEENHCHVFIEEEIKNQLPNDLISTDVNICFAIVIGGDGTLLNKLHTFEKQDYQYFGINMGRVGCLMEASTLNFKEKIAKLLVGDYIVQKRNTLSYEIKNTNKTYIGTAFNEVSVERGKLYKVLHINMFINNHNKTSFYADGVVVATSTGSSAYSLSCGGPLLLSTTSCYVITPICPQLRTITSLVVSDNDTISIDIVDERRPQYEDIHPIVVIDGKTIIEIDENSVINIKKNPKDFTILRVDNDNSLFEPTLKVALSSQELLK